MSNQLRSIFEQEYRNLRPRASMPEFRVEFFPFANVNNTIRLRGERVLVRLSDLLEGAPEAVLRAIAHILLAKLYRKPIDAARNTRYRRHVSSKALSEKAHLVRQMRGRKVIETAHGAVYDLDAIFEELNLRFFHGLLARPQMTWSRDHARNSLGHWDPAHNAIVVSRVFDSARVPRFAVEYIVYHECLHLLYPVKVKNGRRCVHPKVLRDREKTGFPDYQRALAFLKTLQ